jgi:hypothetical protein
MLRRMPITSMVMAPVRIEARVCAFHHHHGALNV